MCARHPWFVLVLALLATGCFSFGDDDGGCEDEPEREDPCARAYTGASLDGDWHLQATGTRSHCDDRRLEGKLEIDSTVPLVIEAAAQPTFRDAGGPQTDNESDAFVQRIERADFELTGDELPRPVTFSGEVRGSCVVFTLSERLPDGDTLDYELSGSIQARGEISGSFTGTGPEQCTTEGSFTASVR